MAAKLAHSRNQWKTRKTILKTRIHTSVKLLKMKIPLYPSSPKLQIRCGNLAIQPSLYVSRNIVWLPSQHIVETSGKQDFHTVTFHNGSSVRAVRENPPQNG